MKIFLIKSESFLTLLKCFLNGERLSSRAVLIGENGGALTLLVSKTVTQGFSHVYALVIASTSQALRLANHNVSNLDCDSSSINRTALIVTVHCSALCLKGLFCLY